MKYLCLIFAERTIGDMSKSEAEGIFADCAEFTSDLTSSGHYIGGHRLLPRATATTVRMHKGQIAFTDGPYAETKEQLGGYYLIEARDMNEAIRIAARSPGARIGCVEVRPVAEDLPDLQVLGAAAVAPPKHRDRVGAAHASEASSSDSAERTYDADSHGIARRGATERDGMGHRKEVRR